MTKNDSLSIEIIREEIFLIKYDALSTFHWVAYIYSPNMKLASTVMNRIFR